MLKWFHGLLQNCYLGLLKWCQDFRPDTVLPNFKKSRLRQEETPDAAAQPIFQQTLDVSRDAKVVKRSEEKNKGLFFADSPSFSYMYWLFVLLRSRTSE